MRNVPNHTWHRVRLAEPNDYIVNPNSPQAWCKDNLGARWDIRLAPMGRWQRLFVGPHDASSEITYEYQFRDAEDAMLFRMRWS